VSFPRRAPSTWFALALLGFDAVLVAGAQQLKPEGTPAAGLVLPALAEAAQSGPRPGTGADSAPVASDSRWAFCQTRLRDRDVSPVMVALTYLEPGTDASVSAEDILRWLGDIEPMAVDVYKLVQKDGTRRVALELARSKWPAWDQVAGDTTGEPMCSRVRAALLAHGVGRPRPAPDQGKSGMHDFEFIYARRPQLYQSIEWVGTLDHVLSGGDAASSLDALLVWLAQEGL
jgi:hypothetical protein